MNKSGFSLVEILVATAIVCLLFSVTVCAVLLCLRTSDRLEHSNVALSLARSKLEETIYQDFHEIVNEANEAVPGYDNYVQRVTVEAINAQGIPHLKRVTVTVDGAGAVESLTTTVAK